MFDVFGLMDGLVKIEFVGIISSDNVCGFVGVRGCFLLLVIWYVFMLLMVYSSFGFCGWCMGLDYVFFWWIGVFVRLVWLR